MKQILLSLLVFVLMTGSTVQAQQDTVYLDINANVVDDKASATEYAIIHKRGKKQFEICFYTLDGKLTRSCEYSQFKRKVSQRTLNGITRYKFQQSEQDSLIVHYTRNRRNGEVIFYYPSGTVMARGQYKDDMLDGPLTQYYENGAVKRKETYKKDVSQGGFYLSTDSTSLDFIPFYQKVAFKAGEEALMKIINLADCVIFYAFPRNCLCQSGTTSGTCPDIEKDSTAEYDHNPFYKIGSIAINTYITTF